MTAWGWHFEWLFTGRMGVVVGLLAVEVYAFMWMERRRFPRL